MRIAIVAPVEESVPPPQYGGIEGVVYDLANGLITRGHEVVLLASGDSRIRGDFMPLCPIALRHCAWYDHPDLIERSKVDAAETAARILATLKPEIVHSHMWRLLRLKHAIDLPMVTTVHYPLDVAHRRPGFTQDGTYVSISMSQQHDGSDLRFVANVYNGIDVDSFRPSYAHGEYLLFLGRLAPEKGADIAIDVARSLGMRLILAAKLASVDYWRNKIWPHVDGDKVLYAGEVNQIRKRQLLRGAYALLYPVRWNEPFGLAMVEAMACGTPVVALNRGGVGEVVADGYTGFLVDEPTEIASAVRKVASLSRRACRDYVKARFTASRMVDEYENIYAALTMAD
jgi:glycosyltransferase involved in cell wall biosynthesis